MYKLEANKYDIYYGLLFYKINKTHLPWLCSVSAIVSFFWSTCRVNTWKSSVKITRLSVCDPRILMLLTIVRITGEIWARLLAHFQWNNDKQKREKIFYFVKPRPVIFALIRSYETVVSMMSGDAHFWIAYTRFPVPVKNILWRHREFWKTHTSWVWQGLSAG